MEFATFLKYRHQYSWVDEPLDELQFELITEYQCILSTSIFKHVFLFCNAARKRKPKRRPARRPRAAERPQLSLTKHLHHIPGEEVHHQKRARRSFPGLANNASAPRLRRSLLLYFKVTTTNYIYVIASAHYDVLNQKKVENRTDRQGQAKACMVPRTLRGESRTLCGSSHPSYLVDQTTPTPLIRIPAWSPKIMGHHVTTADPLTLPTLQCR